MSSNGKLRAVRSFSYDFHVDNLCAYAERRAASVEAKESVDVGISWLKIVVLRLASLPTDTAKGGMASKTEAN